MALHFRLFARRNRGPIAAIGGAAAIALAATLSGAFATSSTTGVAFTPLTPVKAVTGGTSVGANGTYLFVGSGTTSTVPTNATAVQLAVTVKGTKAGTLSFYPNGDQANASPQTLSWAAGGSNAGTVAVNIGVRNKVVVANASLAAATVGIKITGYSTQVTAAGVNGSGGTANQVLTNNGNGTTSWKNILVTTTGISNAGGQPGQVLTIDFLNRVKWLYPNVDPSQVSENGGVDGSVLTQLDGGGVGWVRPPERNTFRAAVNSIGNAPNSASLVADGDATSVTNPSTGFYNIQFGRSLAGCIATANPGTAINGTGVVRLNAVLTLRMQSTGVHVNSYAPDGSSGVLPANTSFLLTMVC
jgi:hypothetical protein